MLCGPIAISSIFLLNRVNVLDICLLVWIVNYIRFCNGKLAETERMLTSPNSWHVYVLNLWWVSYLVILRFIADFSFSSNFTPGIEVSILKDLKYADSHEWVKVNGNSATIGITDHAQDHLGDVVYVELPDVGTAVKQGDSFGAVESVKATSDVNSPVSGKVVEVNEELSSSPALVNSSPYEGGWIIKVEMNDAGELKNLMDSEKYSKFCEEEDSKH
ncbi:hypothetical protein V6N13_078638 [Hibiscus sabdariffa]|uniref:Glycine cleavage system H protein n=1 Tax=Hibiscus sabdariffa TaxID=183260 RepID=A0ABR2RPQ2_9ROSI